MLVRTYYNTISDEMETVVIQSVTSYSSIVPRGISIDKRNVLNVENSQLIVKHFCVDGSFSSFNINVDTGIYKFYGLFDIESKTMFGFFDESRLYFSNNGKHYIAFFHGSSSIILNGDQDFSNYNVDFKNYCITPYASYLEIVPDDVVFISNGVIEIFDDILNYKGYDFSALKEIGGYISEIDNLKAYNLPTLFVGEDSDINFIAKDYEEHPDQLISSEDAVSSYFSTTGINNLHVDLVYNKLINYSELNNLHCDGLVYDEVSKITSGHIYKTINCVNRSSCDCTYPIIISRSDMKKWNIGIQCKVSEYIELQSDDTLVKSLNEEISQCVKDNKFACIDQIKPLYAKYTNFCDSNRFSNQLICNYDNDDCIKLSTEIKVLYRFYGILKTFDGLDDNDKQSMIVDYKNHSPAGQIEIFEKKCEDALMSVVSHPDLYNRFDYSTHFLWFTTIHSTLPALTYLDTIDKNKPYSIDNVSFHDDKTTLEVCITPIVAFSEHRSTEDCNDLNDKLLLMITNSLSSYKPIFCGFKNNSSLHFSRLNPDKTSNEFSRDTLKSMDLDGCYRKALMYRLTCQIINNAPVTMEDYIINNVLNGLSLIENSKYVIVGAPMPSLNDLYKQLFNDEGQTKIFFKLDDYLGENLVDFNFIKSLNGINIVNNDISESFISGDIFSGEDGYTDDGWNNMSLLLLNSSKNGVSVDISEALCLII